MRRNAFIILALGIILLCICIIGSVAMFAIVGSTTTPGNVRVTIDAPSSVPLNEPFLMTVQIRSLTAEGQSIDSIDIQNSYLEGIEVQSTQPAATDQFSIPIVGFETYLFERDLFGNDTVTIEFVMMGFTEGQYSGDIDVCIDNGSNCVSQTIETEIGVGEGR